MRVEELGAFVDTPSRQRAPIRSRDGKGSLALSSKSIQRKRTLTENPATAIHLPDPVFESPLLPEISGDGLSDAQRNDDAGHAKNTKRLSRAKATNQGWEDVVGPESGLVEQHRDGKETNGRTRKEKVTPGSSKRRRAPTSDPEPSPAKRPRYSTKDDDRQKNMISADLHAEVGPDEVENTPRLVTKVKAKVVSREIKKAKPKPVARSPSVEGDNNEVRRSHRTRIKPVKFWKCEKAVYRCSAGDGSVPIRLPELISVEIKEEDTPYRPHLSRKRRVHANTSSSSKAVEIDEPIPVKVWDSTQGVYKEQALFSTPNMMKPKKLQHRDFLFQKLFSEGEHFSAGLFEIPVDCEIPRKNTRLFSMVSTFAVTSERHLTILKGLVVMTGYVRISMNDLEFIIGPGTMSFIPRMNLYRIVNVGEETARVYWFSAKETEVVKGLVERP
ncbi:hypothetical protein BJ742DRAFT_278561 [Cladochytrium replicatum]|nr:hypothetical protein BJ742DRAFT_278561 [Cladochytrium replicatum]